MSTKVYRSPVAFLTGTPEHLHDFQPFVLRDYEVVGATKRRGNAPLVWVTWEDWYLGWRCACGELGYEVPS